MFLQRLLTPLLVVSFLSRAAGADGAASGGQWTHYKPATPSSVTWLDLVSRGDEVQVQGTYSMKVNVATGAVDQPARPAYDPVANYVVADGDSPVFWSQAQGDGGAPLLVRDWSSGAVLDTATLPGGPNVNREFLDDHGLVFYDGKKIGVAGFYGENVQTAATQTTAAIPGPLTVVASSDWIAVHFELPGGGSQYRIEVYDRHTLAYKAGITQSGLISVKGNLLAQKTSNSVIVRELPGLTTLAVIPMQSTTFTGFEMVEGGLWIYEGGRNPSGIQFSYYDLSNPAAPVALHRLPAPDTTSYVGAPFWRMQGSPHFLAFAADDKSLWVWKRNGTGPVAAIVPAGPAHEGEAASFKVKLSSAAPTAVQVQVSAQSGTATEGQDFAAFSTTVNIPAGATESAAQAVTILADTVLEPNESFILASGTTSGCVVEQPKVPVVIAANGFNVTVHPKFLNNRSFRLDNVWGITGSYLVGAGHNYPQIGGDLGRTVAVDVGSGAVAGEMPGTVTATSGDQFYVRDGIFFRNSLDTASAWQVPGFQVIASNIAAGGKILGPLNAQHMLVKKSSPNRLVVAKISDGSELATHPLGSSDATAVIADNVEGIPGVSVAVLDTGVSQGGDSIQLFKVLSPDTLGVARSFSWPAFHPQLGPLPKLKVAAGKHAVFTASYAICAVDTVSGEWRWTVPTTSQDNFDANAAIKGDVLMMRGVGLSGASDEFARFRSFDLKNGTVLENQSFEDIAGTPFTTLAKTGVHATPVGFLVANGRDSASISISPTRPNVELRIEPFTDNRSGELEIVAKENFTGSHSLAIDEYAEVLENLPTGTRLFSTLPQQIEFTAAGETLPLDSKHPASGAETVRVRAMSSTAAGATAGFGKATVTTHVEPVPEQAFFTGAPARNTPAVPVAAAGNLLAVGYPFEPEAVNNPTGLVDLYDKSTGAFLRTIEAPAGVSKMRFGAALAITGNRIVIGAPGNNGYPSLPGKVFVFDTATGAMVRELKLKKAMAFGASIAANDSWIAVGAPGTYNVLPPTGILARKLVPGSVAVFDAKTLKLRYQASSKGEMLGWSVALDGDTLFAGAPLASLMAPVAAPFAGIVRSYALPKGKAKGKALPLLGPLHPVADGHFGLKVAASSSLLAVQASRTEDGKEGVQVHPRGDLKMGAIFGMPGANVKEGALHVTETQVIAGGWGEPLRIFDLDDVRPEASYSLSPGAQDVATDDTHFYWADTAPHRALLPAISSARSLALGSAGGDDVDLNHDGRRDAIDRLLQQRGAKGMPVTIGAGDARQYRFALDADIPEGMAVSFEYSADLTRWVPLLAWDGEAKRWQDAGGHAIGEAGAEGWLYEWQAPEAKVFFRTRVEMAEE